MSVHRHRTPLCGQGTIDEPPKPTAAAPMSDAEYIRREKITGGYTGYYLHNLTFLVWALTMEGRSRDAIAAARELADRTAQHDPPRMARVCGGPSSLMSVWARLGRWDEIRPRPRRRSRSRWPASSGITPVGWPW